MNYDIIIIGAGTSGLTLAKSLETTDLNILVIEKQSEETLTNPPYDGREFAITHLSHKILNDLDMWHRIDAQLHHLLPIHCGAQELRLRNISRRHWVRRHDHEFCRCQLSFESYATAASRNHRHGR